MSDRLCQAVIGKDLAMGGYVVCGASAPFDDVTGNVRALLCTPHHELLMAGAEIGISLEPPWRRGTTEE